LAVLFLARFFRLSVVIPVAVLAIVSITISAWTIGRYWYFSALNPTIVEVGKSALRLVLPSKQTVTFSIDEIDDVRPLKPHRMIGSSIYTSSLLIVARGRRFVLVRYREFAEVNWLADQLRIALGMPPRRTSFASGSLLQNKERTPAQGNDFAIRLESLSATNAPMKPSPVSMGAWIRHEYENLTNPALLFLLIVAFAGIITINYWSSQLALCMEFGTKAYFNGAPRFVPHRGALLTNGRELGAQYRLVCYLIDIAGFVAWTTITLLMSIGLSRLIFRLRIGERSESNNQIKLSRIELRVSGNAIALAPIPPDFPIYRFDVARNFLRVHQGRIPHPVSQLPAELFEPR
jgi:hypothetical protein